MDAQNKIDNLEPIATGAATVPLTDSAKQDVASGKDEIPSDSITSVAFGIAKSSNRGQTGQEATNALGVQYPPTSCYYYPGYPPHPVSYSWDTTYARDVVPGSNNGVKSKQTGGRQRPPGTNNGINSTKTNGNAGNKTFKSYSYAQPLKPFNKVPQFYSDLSMGIMNGYYPAARFSSYGNQGQDPYWYYGQNNYRSNGRVWNGNYKDKAGYKHNRNGEFEASTELTRGPRTYSKNAQTESIAETNELELSVQKDKYNLAEFQTEYEDARFYVIKSYSEDDVHKCIKYNVWTSTPNGNKKLDAAFHDAEKKSSETGKNCPIFLFFSVNGSGQFVGCAEMIAQVDFNKNMDFWQQDKWLGFFPVKWHIIKDIPNAELRHIVLENNENRPVTFSRDTQEIGLVKGLEMLKIFKSYSSKTFLLDDFNFYENREKSLQVKQTSKAPASLSQKPMKDGGRNSEQESTGANLTADATSLVSLTENLSLDATPLKSIDVEVPIEYPVPSALAS